jgi:hypothetical protein
MEKAGPPRTIIWRIPSPPRIGRIVPRGARLANRVAATGEEQGTMRVEVGIDLANRARAVVGADARKGGHARQDHDPRAGGILATG